MQVKGLLLVVNNATHLARAREPFQRAMGACLTLERDETPPNRAITDALDELKVIDTASTMTWLEVTPRTVTGLEVTPRTVTGRLEVTVNRSLLMFGSQFSVRATVQCAGHS